MTAGTDTASRRLHPGMADPAPTSIPLSVLDLAPVGRRFAPRRPCTPPSTLARHVERLGYRRFWVAEHHNMPGIASSSPAGAARPHRGRDHTIRIGSGGVMLPNHAPLVVAEQFGMLEALHPGRIDLGIGRAPGTDQVTASALRRSSSAAPRDDFPDQLVDLLGFFTGRSPRPPVRAHHRRARARLPAAHVVARLQRLQRPGRRRARPAVLLRAPLRRGQHVAALALYRSIFRPSGGARPALRDARVAVACAPTDERARWLAGSAALSFLRLRSAARVATRTRGGGRPRVHAVRAGDDQGLDWVARGRQPRDRAPGPAEPRRPDRRRRADGDDDGALHAERWNPTTPRRTFSLVPVH